MRHLRLFSIMIALCALAAKAQSAETADSAAFIVDAINAAAENITVSQAPDLIKITSNSSEAFHSEAAAPSQRGLGYRIQVFSDNNARTAKANAEYRKRLVESQNDDLRGYLTFESPYWRVRVGDFRTQAEANAAMRRLKSMFPAFANDLRLVRERINPAQ